MNASRRRLLVTLVFLAAASRIDAQTLSPKRALPRRPGRDRSPGKLRPDLAHGIRHPGDRRRQLVRLLRPLQRLHLRDPLHAGLRPDGLRHRRRVRGLRSRGRRRGRDRRRRDPAAHRGALLGRARDLSRRRAHAHRNRDRDDSGPGGGVRDRRRDRDRAARHGSHRRRCAFQRQRHPVGLLHRIELGRTDRARLPHGARLRHHDAHGPRGPRIPRHADRHQRPRQRARHRGGRRPAAGRRAPVQCAVPT